MTGGAIGAVHDEKFLFPIPINKWGSIRVLALEFGLGHPVDRPDRIAGFLVEFDDLARPGVVIAAHRTMKQLKVKRLSIEHRSAGHPELNVELAITFVHVDLPNRLAIDGKTSQDASSEETPNMLAIGARRWRCRVALASPGVLIARPDLLLP